MTADDRELPRGPSGDTARDRELESLRAERREMGEELLRLHVDHATITAAWERLRRENVALRRAVQELADRAAQLVERAQVALISDVNIDTPRPAPRPLSPLALIRPPRPKSGE